jgi:radical SAM superfamily enzyme YgiQ (UPF0313 family)
MKILLVNSPVSVNNPRAALPPLPLLVLGACLKDEVAAHSALQVQLLDLDLLLKQGLLRDSAEFFPRAVHLIAEQRPDMGWFTVHGANVPLVLELLELLRHELPGCVTVLGGVAATLQAREIIERFPQVDVIIRGAGEPAVAGLVDAGLRGDRDYSAVPSAVFRRGDAIIENERLDDDLPFRFPDYDLVDLDQYVEHNKRHPYIFPGFALVESGRGCAFNCSFCAPKRMWDRRVRYRPVAEIIAEMRFLAQRGLDFTFYVQDNLSDEFLRELGAALIADQVNIPWGGYARLDQLGDETAALIGRAGCRLLFVGLETSSAKAQRAIHKPIDRAAAFGKLKHLNASGVTLICSFIAGFDGETDDELNETMVFALECAAGLELDELIADARARPVESFPSRPVNFGYIHPLCFFPGTDTFAVHRARLRLTEHSYHHDSYGSHLFGLSDLIRRHWDFAGHTYTTHLDDATLRRQQSRLRVFNLLAHRPHHLARLLAADGARPIDLTQRQIRRLGDDFVLRSSSDEFERAVSEAVSEDLGVAVSLSIVRQA